MKVLFSGLKTVRSNPLLALGLFLLLISAYPLLLMAREIKSLSDADSRYEIAAYGWQSTGDEGLHFKLTRTGNHTFINFQGQKVTLSDKFKMSRRSQDTDPPDKRQLGLVNININGKDYTYDSLVEIRTEEGDSD